MRRVDYEAQVLGAEHESARAAARVLAVHARQLLASAQAVLEAAGDEQGAAWARAAVEATTGLVGGTYNGELDLIACSRTQVRE